MKKEYIAPVMELDLLKYEISDIITVSMGDNDLPAPGDWWV